MLPDFYYYYYHYYLATNMYYRITPYKLDRLLQKSTIGTVPTAIYLAGLLAAAVRSLIILDGIFVLEEMRIE